MDTTRRSLLVGLGCIIAAPAIVRASSLMKVKAPPSQMQSIIEEMNRIYLSLEHEPLVVLWNGDSDSTSWTPNAETIAAMKECEEGNLRRWPNVDQMLAQLISEE